ncbi:enoyl-CoA hydratase/isomerase family protein [Salinadaptatus halalkaliphilus]|uniref:Enoyl-CoA hydratase/isomerase family protein n=1 Tax=Salinadaptatus halalkaliphilus TaxID=2419781 RepID=A0A4S3TSI8_9EURY|nr:enoyl-CoA hydratase/isomerase family protein [Salinadaptatus halalkaliphilus]
MAHLRLDAGQLNLLSPAVLEELHETIRSVPDDVAVLTIAGADDGLTAGLKLDAVRECSTTEARAVLSDLYGAMDALRDLSAVTICGCGGYALGAGLELAMACDFRVATSDAALGLPEIDVGLVTGIHGGLLIRLVGLQRAKELVYTGETITGEHAAEIGLVNRAVGADEHDEAVTQLVDRVADKSPLVLQYQSEVFAAWRSAGIERGIDSTLETIAACFDTADQYEGMTAFLEDREPTFTGE